MKTGGIILAAGIGKRIQKISQGKPKLLVQVRNRPLIYYPLSIFRKIGVHRIVIIVPGGWSGEVHRALGNVSRGVIIVENSRFWRENGYSLYLGLKHLLGTSDLILLSMVDHLYVSTLALKVLSTLKNTNNSLIAVGGDSKALFIQHSEATKIRARNHLIVDIGKKLPVYNYIDVGVMAVKPEIYDYINELIDKEEILSLTKIIKYVSKERRAVVADVTGYYWTEIDTDEDYYQLVSGKRNIVLSKVLEDLEVMVHHG